jgi:hypothetical protein
MPSTRFRTIKDAERFCQWLIEQGARGRMNGNSVSALRHCVADFAKLRQLMENDLLDKLKDLLTRANDEYERLREIASAEIGTD